MLSLSINFPITGWGGKGKRSESEGFGDSVNRWLEENIHYLLFVERANVIEIFNYMEKDNCILQA